MSIVIQNRHQFTANSYEFILELNGDHLILTATCHDTFSQFTKKIDEETIHADKALQFFFTSPLELFEYLKKETLYDNIQLTSEGMILLNISVNVGPNSRTYECKIQSEKVQMSKQMWAQSKIQEYSHEMQKLKKGNQMKLQEINKQQNQLHLFKDIMNQCRKKIEENDSIILNIQQNLQRLKQFKKYPNGKSKKIEQLYYFQPHPNNPHTKKFTQKGNRFIKTQKGSWDGLMNKRPIPLGKTTIYQILQIKAGQGGSFMYGVGTKDLFGLKRPQDNPNFTGYYQLKGTVYQKGVYTSAGPQIKDGDLVIIEVNTILWTICWFVSGKKVAEVVIPTEMRQRDIFLTIIVFNEGSQIQFI